MSPDYVFVLHLCLGLVIVGYFATVLLFDKRRPAPCTRCSPSPTTCWRVDCPRWCSMKSGVVE